MVTEKELKEMSNEEFVVHVMNYSRYGALSQIALMQVIEVGINSLRKYYEKQKDSYNGNAFLVNPEAMLGVLDEISDKYNKKYSS
jgi:hypothetical protein